MHAAQERHFLELLALDPRSLSRDFACVVSVQLPPDEADAPVVAIALHRWDFSRQASAAHADSCHVAACVISAWAVKDRRADESIFRASLV